MWLNLPTSLNLKPDMKTVRGLVMEETRHTGIQLELSPSPTIPSRLQHSRSASWSFTLPQSRGHSEPSSGGLASLNPITPITSVIREIVSSRGESSSTINNNTRPHRSLSQISLLHGLDGRLSPTSPSPPSSPPSWSDLPDNHHHHLGGGGLATGGDAGDGSTHINTNGNAMHEEQNNVAPEVGQSLKWLERNAVFFILLLISFAWYHRSGLMVILGMFGTFLHCNHTIRTQVALKSRRSKIVLFFVILFLAANIFFVYYVFWDQRLHYWLIFREPVFVLNLWNQLWCIWVTDFIIRFGTMALKALVAACFLRIIPVTAKGKFYVLLEHLSCLYRSLAPTPHWIWYFSDPEPSGAVFAVLLTAAYLMVKGFLVFQTVRELLKNIVSFIRDSMQGRPPSKSDLEEYGCTCAICQEDLLRPIMLKCRHIFCENCLLQWFDRQNTCPLCRALVSNHDPKWRDGSTNSWPQLF